MALSSSSSSTSVIKSFLILLFVTSCFVLLLWDKTLEVEGVIQQIESAEASEFYLKIILKMLLKLTEKYSKIESISKPI